MEKENILIINELIELIGKLDYNRAKKIYLELKKYSNLIQFKNYSRLYNNIRPTFFVPYDINDIDDKERQELKLEIKDLLFKLKYNSEISTQDEKILNFLTVNTEDII